MWVTNASSNKLTELSPTGATLGTYPAGTDPQSIAFDGTNMWVVDQVLQGTVTKLSPTGAVLGIFMVDDRPAGSRSTAATCRSSASPTAPSPSCKKEV